MPSTPAAQAPLLLYRPALHHAPRKICGSVQPTTNRDRAPHHHSRRHIVLGIAQGREAGFAQTSISDAQIQFRIEPLLSVQELQALRHRNPLGIRLEVSSHPTHHSRALSGRRDRTRRKNPTHGAESPYPAYRVYDCVSCSCFFQRARAAFFAISLRRSAERFFALAGPPFSPPRLPSAAAARLVSLSSLIPSVSASSVACLTKWKASSFRSCFLDRSCMRTSYCRRIQESTPNSTLS